MGILTDLPIRQVFKHARRLRVGENPPLGPACAWPGNAWASLQFASCSTQIVHPLAPPETPGAFYRGSAWWASMATLPTSPTRTPTPRPSHVTSAPQRRAFPQLRKLSLVELGTHVELALVGAVLLHGEQSMVDGLLRHFGREMLLLEDRRFFSYDHWKKVTIAGRQAVGA